MRLRFLNPTLRNLYTLDTLDALDALSNIALSNAALSNCPRSQIIERMEEYVARDAGFGRGGSELYG